MGLVQEENLVVFDMCLPWEASETTHKEEGNTRGPSQKPAVGKREHGRKDKEQAFSSGPKVREHTDEKKLKKSGGGSCD